MRYVALLRAVNVGGTGKLLMKDLVAVCERMKFGNVRTYVQSGNVLFDSELGEGDVRDALEKALESKMGKKVAVMVRTEKELRGIVEANPFAEYPPAKVAVAFLQTRVNKDAVTSLRGADGEQVQPGKRELYIYFPNGMGQSKLRFPASMGEATSRNINTVRKLAKMLEGE